jgi:selenocysteine lyase/cysteine desulfurase
MSLTRRNFIARGSLSVAAATLSPLVLQAETQKPAKAAQTSGVPRYDDWAAVRREFTLDPGYVHLGLFYIASHPRPVREAIERYRKQLDANPFLTVERGVFDKPETNIPIKVTQAVADYIGGDADDIALTQNTTTGLSLIYHGLPLRQGDEVLTTTHDHYVHHDSIRLAAKRCGATWRKIPLFDSYDSISPDEIASRIRKNIGPKTRVVGVTWVHSSSGVRLPVRRIADAVAEANAGRDEKDRVLLVVDGVHGIGVEDPKITAMGCDAFAAGTHKWIFGPRGTGFVWAKRDVWARMLPLIPPFYSLDEFNAWEDEHDPKGPPRAAWFSPGGFQAYEHHWALPAAFDFHKAIGPARITQRIHELNQETKAGLARMSHVKLHTPMDENLSAGMACFEVKGMKPVEVVDRLLEKKIIASNTPYLNSYARFSTAIINTSQEVDRALAAVRELA